MLPSAPKSHGRLSDVFQSAALATSGKSNQFGLPTKLSYLVVMVDGLGSNNIRGSGAHASFLNSRLRRSLFSGFPTTTASSLASLATGLPNGKHGFLGYRIFDRETGSGINLLNDLGDRFPPRKFQDQPTVSETATTDGLRVLGIGPGEYRDSGFTRATMPGATYLSEDSLDLRFELALKELRNSGSLIYLYIPELDQIAHRFGVASTNWLSKLEDLDSQVLKFSRSLNSKYGALLTADHGVIDVPREDQVELSHLASLREILHVGGDPRTPFLYFESGMDIRLIREQLISEVGSIAHVATIFDLVESGWLAPLGRTAQRVAPDLVIVPKGNKVFYHARFAKKRSMEMIGQHGGITKNEWEVPLIEL